MFVTEDNTVLQRKISKHNYICLSKYEPQHDKANKMTVRPGWSEYSLGAHAILLAHICVNIVFIFNHNLIF